MGFHVGRAGTGANAADFIFYEQFADERLAEARGMWLALDLAFFCKRGEHGDILRYLRSTRMLWERHVITEDISKCLVPAFALEWCGAEKHFIH